MRTKFTLSLYIGFAFHTAAPGPARGKSSVSISLQMLSIDSGERGFLLFPAGADVKLSA